MASTFQPVCPDCSKPKRPDDRQALWAHRRQSGVDVVAGLFPGRERELTTLGGAFGKQS